MTHPNAKWLDSLQSFQFRILKVNRPISPAPNLSTNIRLLRLAMKKFTSWITFKGHDFLTATSDTSRDLLKRDTVIYPVKSVTAWCLAGRFEVNFRLGFLRPQNVSFSTWTCHPKKRSRIFTPQNVNTNCPLLNFEYQKSHRVVRVKVTIKSSLLWSLGSKAFPVWRGLGGNLHNRHWAIRIKVP